MDALKLSDKLLRLEIHPLRLLVRTGDHRRKKLLTQSTDRRQGTGIRNCDLGKTAPLQYKNADRFQHGFADDPKRRRLGSPPLTSGFKRFRMRHRTQSQQVGQYGSSKRLRPSRQQGGELGCPFTLQRNARLSLPQKYFGRILNHSEHRHPLSPNKNARRLRRVFWGFGSI